MKAVEFTTEITESGVLAIPSEAAARLPKTGRVRVIILTGADADEADWRRGAYEQFMSDDTLEDQVYDSLR